jgi:hypothetical protein
MERAAAVPAVASGADPDPAALPSTTSPDNTIAATGAAVLPALAALAAASAEERGAVEEVRLEFADVPAGALPRLAAGATRLSTLRLDGLTGAGAADGETVALLAALPSPASLTLLSHYWNTAMRDALFILGGGAFTALATLSLSGCRRVADAGLAAVAGGCPALRRLDVTRCTDLTDGGMAAAVAELKELREFRAYAVETFGDATLAALASHCPQLALLDATGARGVTDEGAAAWARASRHVASLHLGWVARVGDGLLTALGSSCPTLTELNLHGNRAITDAGLRALAAGCPLLAALDVRGAIGTTAGQDELGALFPGVREWRLQR